MSNSHLGRRAWPISVLFVCCLAFAFGGCGENDDGRVDDTHDDVADSASGDVSDVPDADATRDIETAGDGTETHDDGDAVETDATDASEEVEADTNDDVEADVADIDEATEVDDTTETTDTTEPTDTTDTTTIDTNTTDTATDTGGTDTGTTDTATDTGSTDTGTTDTATDTGGTDTGTTDTATDTGGTDTGTTDTATDTGGVDTGTTDTATTDATTTDTSVSNDTADTGPVDPTCPAVCFDNNACTVDGCAPDGSCLSDVAALGASCPAGFCTDFGVCVKCIDDAPDQAPDRGCSPGAPMCDGGRFCRECVVDSNCAFGLVCDPDDFVCANCDNDAECDDGFECTIDVCNDRRCERLVDDAICDDTLFCNGDERCDPLALDADEDGCAHSEAPPRNDAFACTVDVCVEASETFSHTPDDTRCADPGECATVACSATLGCVVTPVSNGAPCADGANVCAAGACVDCIASGAGCGGATPFCVAGACVACVGDGDCGGDLTCTAGVCRGCSLDAQCNDGVACTLDVCDPDTTACVNVASDAQCDDGLFCTGLEHCSPASAFADADGCIALHPPLLDDGVACTIDACDEAGRTVTHAPDRDLCDDANPCTEEVCRLDVGCVHTALEGLGPCAGDVGVCNSDGECGTCSDNLVAQVDVGCDDDQPDCVAGVCTTCVVAGPECPLDCAGEPNGGARRDACGVCDADASNDCLGLCNGKPCGAICDGSIAGECDDRNACTLDACVAGRCRHDSAAMDDAVCDDGDACSPTSQCDAGACVGVRDCDGACDTGACNPAVGCAHVAPGSECDDGSPLTDDEQCTASGTCVGSCDDGNPCTRDVAGPTGCSTTPLDAGTAIPSAPCSSAHCDGAGRLVTDIDVACATCNAAACAAQCYSGGCDANGACAPSSAGTPCDDADAETSDDVCDGLGNCAGDCPPIECGHRMSSFGGCGEVVEIRSDGKSSCPDDGDPCTRESCSSDGVCERAIDVGARCDHDCGIGVCGADGSCALEVDQCQDKLGHCWRGAACDLGSGQCAGTPNDPYCLVPGNICDKTYDFCRHPSYGFCGDGVCEANFEANAAYGGFCEADCRKVGMEHVRMPGNNAFNGVYQGFASAAYGFEPPHQTVTVTKMMQDRIRWYHQVIDYCDIGTDNGELCVCEAENRCPTRPVKLLPILQELSVALHAYPDAIVFIQLEASWVHAVDLRAVFEQSGLLDLEYRHANNSALEPWALTMRTMAAKNRRLIVFAPGFMSYDNLYFGRRTVRHQQLESDSLAVPYLGLAFGDGIEDPTPTNYDCIQDIKNDQPPPPGGDKIRNPRLISVRHIADNTGTWNESACYAINKHIVNHSQACKIVWNWDTDIFAPWQAFLFEFYNSAAWPTNIANDFPHGALYSDTCPSDAPSCKTDADCVHGVCGPFKNCIECRRDDECGAGRFCDDALNACREPLLDGSQCGDDAECVSGRCRTVCVSCDDDSACEASEFCDARGACMPLRFSGEPCTKDGQCVSDICRVGYCAECNDDAVCEDDEYCTLGTLPGKSVCHTKESNGTTCGRDPMCASDICNQSKCRECEALEDCAADEFCENGLLDPDFGSCMLRGVEDDACNRNVECLSGDCRAGQCVENCVDGPCGAGRWCDILNVCQDTKDNGSGCLGDAECQTGACYLGTCVECDDQDDCGAGTFCSLDFDAGESMCVDKRALGDACGSSFECESDACYGLQCAECNSQDDCGADDYCTLEFGDSQCAAKKDIGEGCFNDFECGDGNCWNLVCAACDEHSDCDGFDYCTLDVATPRESHCEARKGFGDTCVTGVECLNGGCILGHCAECSQDTQCANNEFCSIVGECVSDLGNGTACTRESMCTSGHCPGGFCRECGTDAHCAADDHCSATFQCVADLSNGGACTRNSICDSNQCIAGVCRECANDSTCAPSDHCNAVNTCADDLGNGAVCLRDSFCTSDHCVAGFCRQCAGDANCPADDHCSAGLQCIDDVNNGVACTRDSVCASNHCIAGFCRECSDDSNCGPSDHCNGVFQCVDDFANGTACLSDSACTSGECVAGFCRACRDDSNCAANDHCNGVFQCVDDFANGTACLSDSACTSGECVSGFCRACRDDSNCAANQHCNGVFQCAADVANNQPCLRDSFCSTGQCIAGACAECQGDGDCAGNEFCNTLKECVVDHGNNGTCTRAAMCSTGICSAGFCAECVSNSHCASGEFCDAGGDCQDRRPDGQACTLDKQCETDCCGLGRCGGGACD